MEKKKSLKFLIKFGFENTVAQFAQNPVRIWMWKYNAILKKIGEKDLSKTGYCNQMCSEVIRNT